MVSVEPAAPSIPHPLEPLTADEITAAGAILRAAGWLDGRRMVASATLREPDKSVVRGAATNGHAHRQADVVVLDRDAEKAFEVLVDIGSGAVASARETAGQPGMAMGELSELDATVKAHPEFQAAMARRGITDLSLVLLDAWPNGNFGSDEDNTRRLARPLAWVSRVAGDNPYARPIEGLIIVYDLHRKEVVRIEDHGLTPLPPEDGNYAASQVPNQRTDIRKLDITQPDGPSFEIEGHRIRWQRWDIRFGFTHREGLVLHQVGYEDGGRLRPILYRGSLSEMIVPYGDPGIMHNRKNAVDAGEYGLGMCTNSLELGCDCLGEIRYFDGVIADGACEPVVIKNAICLHEEDYGIGWKHFGETRRSRRLVLSSIATVGNYDYGFFWYFYQDGMIEFEIKLTGIVSTGALAPGETRKYGAFVAPQVWAPIHQHFFSVRLDMELDGDTNSVYEMNAATDPAGPDNPHGNAFFMEPTLLETEAAAQRTVNPATARYWKIVNSRSLNRLGEPVGYKLVPGENCLPLNLEGSSLHRRAGFTRKHLWVTPYNRDEMHAAGQYPNQCADECGLGAWTAANRPVADTDIVVWYTLGHTHQPRPEDWPVMPVYYAGMRLMPVGFFDRNPALDVPPSMKHGDHCQ